ncbi:hypothetical protein OG205_44150 [Lentzea sp. NBC_00516]|uniref:hypothetical protein n=1 Tax=Lentzea sp. NBC_00516 TaxID=2903582 RepID=UPI002E814BA6|nr:hypothetical protein [Lentzea sp. NBC_00516]WUD24940.1 hypothetical protein OG205_44150 [Lentzea sp. NBC_00516]
MNTGVVTPDLGEPEPNDEPGDTAQLRIEFDDKAVDVRGPSGRLHELTDSMSLAVATVGGVAGPTLALGALPDATPVWVTGAVAGAQLVFLAYVVTTIFVRGRRTRSA